MTGVSGGQLACRPIYKKQAFKIQKSRDSERLQERKGVHSVWISFASCDEAGKEESGYRISAGRKRGGYGWKNRMQ